MTISILTSHPDQQPREFQYLYEGCVLDTRQMNGYDDSDFYALCWDEAEGRVVRYTYASTRCWTYMNGAVVDAPAELRMRLAERAAEKVASSVASTEAAVRAEVMQGATVKVTGGRSYIGREGKVFWKGEKKNPYTRVWEMRVGVEDADGRFFLPMAQVTVTECPLSSDKVAAEVERRLRRALTDMMSNDGIGVAVDEVWPIVDRVLSAPAVV